MSQALSRFGLAPLGRVCVVSVPKLLQKLSKYYGLSKCLKYSSYEELFALHSELVMNMALKDFELFRAALTRHRCRTFLKKVPLLISAFEFFSSSHFLSMDIFVLISYSHVCKICIVNHSLSLSATWCSVHVRQLNLQEIIKYWYQRYRLFSKLDKGVLMDREGWFSVTPERIAEHIADRMVRQPGILIVDAFAGVGGNSIQLALKGARVIAIDMDPIRLKCARENARVYGVEDRIDFICCDFFHFASKWMNDVGKPVDAVFLSPPWGGPSYLKSTVFDLDDLNPNGFDIFTVARKLSPNIAYFLPRNTALKQLISLSGSGGRCEIEQSCLNKKIKTLTAYYGSLAVQRS
ncbi:unnamed protein product [Angiostrongylus costaricensis]|uniref:Trimethylguanosine synthase n=1 Tax=Angiostrongylus costaricensis TaxID=334426 RepID=A0A0R3PDI9_ANGCS|nr:unnamed protein product [Angiostrongylus costaricensis]